MLFLVSFISLVIPLSSQALGGILFLCKSEHLGAIQKENYSRIRIISGNLNNKYLDYQPELNYLNRITSTSTRVEACVFHNFK